jgi:hypothetical protein
MKHVRIVLVGVSLLVGIPWVLLAIGGGPRDAVDRLWGGTLVSNPERLAAMVELGTWLAWAWICLAVIVQVWASRRSDPILVGRHRLVVLFVASLWSVFAAMRSTPALIAVTSDSGVEVVEVKTPQPIPLPVGPLASVQCALIAEYMLRRSAERRLDTIRKMSPDQEVIPLSRPVDLFWRSLSMRKGTGLNHDKIPVGIDQSGGVVSSSGLVEVQGGTVEEIRQICNHLSLSVEALGKNWQPNESNTLVQDTHGWQLSTGERLRPFGLSIEDGELYERLLIESGGMQRRIGQHSAPPENWLLCVRLLGNVEARMKDGTVAPFIKMKSLELLSWLVTHRDRPTRSAARTAMWMMDVKDSYFNNVVTGLRQTLAVTCGLDRQTVLHLDSYDRLNLSVAVISDAELLRVAFENFRTSQTQETSRYLRDALSLVRDLPFSGADYLWPDAEGITSNLVHLVHESCIDLAEYARSNRRTDLAEFSYGVALRMFPGDESILDWLNDSLSRHRKSRIT